MKHGTMSAICFGAAKIDVQKALMEYLLLGKIQ